MEKNQENSKISLIKQKYFFKKTQYYLYIDMKCFLVIY